MGGVRRAIDVVLFCVRAPCACRVPFFPSWVWLVSTMRVAPRRRDVPVFFFVCLADLLNRPNNAESNVHHLACFCRGGGSCIQCVARKTRHAVLFVFSTCSGLIMRSLIFVACFCRACGSCCWRVVSRVQGEGVSDLAITASKNALELAGVDGADIDLVSSRDI